MNGERPESESTWLVDCERCERAYQDAIAKRGGNEKWLLQDLRAAGVKPSGSLYRLRGIAGKTKGVAPRKQDRITRKNVLNFATVCEVESETLKVKGSETLAPFGEGLCTDDCGPQTTWNQ